VPVDWIEILGDFARSVTLRPITETDLPFLERLYASTRRDELARLEWSEAQKRDFLAQQFRAQHEHYRENFPEARFLLVERRGEPIGRIYLDRRSDEIRLIDIAFVPEQRGQGLGTAMMDRLLAAAGRQGLPVRLHVESFNPAYRLYERLGFKWLEDRGVYQFMEWRPDGH
jgi:ribosomal protein S18 acetylase RimI-like enzyme